MFQANLTTTQVLSKLERGREEGLGEIIFSGGEPTVRHDIVDLVRAARELGYNSIVLQTNARSLAQSDLAEKLTTAGVTRYVISLHGHIAEIHDSITRVPGSFTQALTGIRNVQRSWAGQARIVIHCVILPSNFEHLLSLVKLVISLDIPMIKLSYVVPVGRASGIHGHDTAPSMSQTLPYLFSALDEFLAYSQGYPRTTASVGYYPFCLLHGYERYSDDLGAPPNYLITEEGDFLPATYEIEKQGLKVKGPGCYRCTFGSLCSGVWREYPEAYGWDEFTPITDYAPQDIVPELFQVEKGIL
jgi:MoaA/NifB/PqqE/SkfB family radical SAM enzyme